jgi:methionine-rich copper-binding protein CopC
MDTSNQQRERSRTASFMRDARRVMKALRASFAALLLLALAAGPAGASVIAIQAQDAAAAAPDYLSSEPENGAMLEEAPSEVSVTFDEPIDPDSSLSVSDECGRKLDDGNVQVNPNSMSVGIALKPSGTYTVTYFVKGLGGVTGQQTGTFSFMVHSGQACDGGGGHGGHGGEGNDGGGNDHGGNGGHNDADHEGNDHNMGDGSHDPGTHSSTDHGTSTDQNATHAAMDHSQKRGRGPGHGGRHGNKHGQTHPPLVPRQPKDAGEGTTLAADESAIPLAPDGAAVLTALL